MRFRVSGIFERRRIGEVALAAVMAATLLLAAHGAAAQHAKPSPSKDEKGPAIEGPTFVQMRPIILPIVEGNRVTRTVGVVLALELEKGRTEAELEPNRIKLRDAFITELYSFIDQHKETARTIDTVAVKERLQATSDRILGAGVVHEVLVQQAFERPRKP